MSPWKPGQKLKDIEAATMDAALAYYGGNKTNAALALNISVRTMRKWCNGGRKKYQEKLKLEKTQHPGNKRRLCCGLFVEIECRKCGITHHRGT